MELFLSVWFNPDGSFIVNRQLAEPYEVLYSVLKLDYSYTPWPRVNGNLLWE